MSVLQTGIGPAKGFYPYAINQSLRFNDDDSAYLSRTPASAGNRKTWTFSAWVKRGNLGSFQGIATVGDASDQTRIAISSNDNLLIFSRSSGVLNLSVNTDSAFRDCSAWYHVVINVDTTQASQANRLKIYTNGVETSYSGSTLLGLNVDTFFNTTLEHRISRYEGTNDFYFDGYMAEINFIDGQALDPTSFGEFKSGVWVANEYTGTYGTNGFYLPFENGLGNDESGNGNDWTPNNLAATDIVLDSPTNNFATLNPLATDGGTLSDGNLKLVTPSSGFGTTLTSFGVSSGKWYWEVTNVSGTTAMIGVVDNTFNIDGGAVGYLLSGGDLSIGYYGNDGDFYNNGSSSAYGASYTSGDVIGVALDMDAGTIEFFKNNVSQGSESISFSTTMIPAIGDTSASAVTLEANFGQLGFTYTPPTGYLALSTANLPEPAISPANDESPSDYFNTVLYTGNGGTNSITGVGFQPDWVWIKSRSLSSSSGLFDSVRGAGQRLISDATNAEFTDASFDSFDTDGFGLADGDNPINASGQTYVAWNWKAGGAGVTNTDGSITSTVSASPESGFSIVSYTGNGTTGATVGHGLDSQIEMLIVKDRDADVYQWNSWHVGLSVDHFIALSNSSAEGSSVLIWDTSGMTNSVFTHGSFTGGHNVNGNNYIAYCFHSVEGYSKFGSYTGNGSTDGPFVYTGFRPAIIIRKNASSTGTWIMYDVKRDESNAADQQLFANLTNSESTSSGNPTDILSNGFKMRGTGGDTNSSGDTYIYMAFAEDGGPFKYSRAR